MDFYTNVQMQGNKVLVRGIKDGKEYRVREDFAPTLFVRTEKPTEWHTIYGDGVTPVEFSDIGEARDFVKQYKGVDNFPIFGQTDWRYQYITENFTDARVAYDPDQIRIETLDIETSSEFGFPSIANPIEEVLLITLQNKATKRKITFGSRPFDTKKIQHVADADKVTYVQCRTERELLEKFLAFWSENTPDILTGWNVKLFDVPYLVRRMERVLGEAAIKTLSPWGQVRGEETEIMGRTFQVFEIVGVSVLDYLDLYKKFTYTTRESYKLDFIAQVELGKEKLKTQWETYQEFYTNDWHNFVEYNIIDVELVDGLEDKLRLIELVVALAYDAKCNFNDIFSPVRTWDCLIYNHLWKKNQVIPQRSDAEGRQIAGAFVKEPRPGMYKWVVSFDATSLYPSIMLAYNLSPEMLAEGEFVDGTVRDFLDREFNLIELHQKNLAMTANGFCFRRDQTGIFPEIVARIFDERQAFKKQMLQAAQEYENTHSTEAKMAKARFKVFQEARKILLNSLYGALANKYFRFYDDRIAEGITLTGQFIIQTAMEAINTYLNKLLGTSKVDYAFYGDTDSLYITLDGLVEKFFQNLTPDQIVDKLDAICKEKLTLVINKACGGLGEYTNSFAPERISFKREVIADRGVWVAKKRYALNAFDSEGVRYETPDLKVQGLEIVRSSTPAPVREKLKEAVRLVLTSTQKELQSFIQSFENEFRNLSPEEIAFPRGVNGLGQYASTSSIFQKGCPIHVRGALLYNYAIKNKGLDKKYELIREGDKIRFLYLKVPNTIGENVVAFTSAGLPKELDLHRFVDYNKMYESTFLSPLETILKSIGWDAREQATLEDLFV